VVNACALQCENGTSNVLPATGEITRDYSKVDSFVIYMCMEGNATIEVSGNKEQIKMGETILIPASCNQVGIESEGCELLEVYI
jgi:mannose-6-phosphate isomerase